MTAGLQGYFVREIEMHPLIDSTKRIGQKGLTLPVVFGT